MKILKTVLASFVLLALTTAFANNASAQTTGEIVYIASPNFQISSGSQATLQNTSNWGDLQALGTKTNCSGVAYLCKVTFSYTLELGQTDPSRSDIIAGIASAYNNITHTFASSFTTVSGVVVTITIVEKANV